MGSTRKTTPLPAVDRTPNLVAQVEQHLRRAVADGRFPGGRLPTAVELADQFGVSRETVRLAARNLQREGLLTMARRRGMSVSAAAPTRPAGAPGPTVVMYVQAGYAARDGEEAVTPATGGLMLQGAVEEAGREGLSLLAQHPLHTEVGRAVERLHREQTLRGVIFASYGEEKLLRRVTGWGLPVVLLDHSLPRMTIPSVREDSFGGGRLAVRHLAGLGHRRIAFVNWHRTDLNPWRTQGYRQGLREAGLRRRAAWELTAELTPSGARRSVDALLALAPRPTAVYCFNNTLARLVIDTLAGRGVRVPADVSVIGGGGEVVPGLTCHQADWHKLGRTAVKTLIQVAAGRSPAAHLAAHALVTGQTAAPPSEP